MRGYPRDEIIQHRSQLQQLLVDMAPMMAGRSSGGKSAVRSAAGRYRACDSPQLLYSTAVQVAFPTRQFGTRIDAEDWRLSVTVRPPGPGHHEPRLGGIRSAAASTGKHTVHV